MTESRRWTHPTPETLSASADPIDQRRGSSPYTFSEVWRQSRHAAGNQPSPLLVPIGLDDNGRPDNADLSDDAVLLVSGPPRTGKTTVVRSILAGVLMGASPEEARLAIVDTRGDEYLAFADAPHLLVPPVTDPQDGIVELTDIAGEIETRLDSLSREGARDIADLESQQRPARIVVVIDDLLPILRVDATSAIRLLIQLAGRGRPVGVHAIISTAAPLSALSDIASNVTEQVSFDGQLLSGEQASEAVLPGGRLDVGEFLWEPIQATYPIKRRTIPVSPLEIRRIVEHWLEQEQEHEAAT